MSYAATLEERLAENLAKEYAPQGTAAEGVAGFLPPGLLEILIPLILSLLKGCLEQDEDADPSTLDAIFQRWVVSRAVRRDDDIERKDRAKSINAIIATLNQSSKEEVRGLMQEINNVPVDWDIF